MSSLVQRVKSMLQYVHQTTQRNYMYKGFDYEVCSDTDLSDVVAGMSRQLLHYTKQKYTDNTAMQKRLQKAIIQAKINKLQKELEAL